MSQAGQVVLVNGTPYAWDLIEDESSHAEWGFRWEASTVESWSTCSVRVEASSETSGRAKYQLHGTNHTFEIQASGQKVSANFTELETNNAVLGSSHVLGQVSDKPCYFVLSGTSGNFSSIGDVRDWMQKKLPQLGQRNLSQICIAASHDAGMSISPWLTTLAGSGSVVTQVKSIEEQLHLGIRHFDVRPHLFKDEGWVCGHYDYVKEIELWQGGNGESVSDIVDGINRFTESSKEFITIKLHEVRGIKNRSGGPELDFYDLSPDQWRDLLRRLTTIRDMWTPSPEQGPSERIKLTQIPLRDFIGGSRAAVVIIADPPPEVDVSQYKGCFRSSSWEWESTDWQAPESKRLQMFKDRNPQIPYSYSGCHTQDFLETISSTAVKFINGLAGLPLVEDSNSVVSLAKGPKEKVFRELLPFCLKESIPIPNAISFDAIGCSDMAALAMAFTDLAMS